MKRFISFTGLVLLLGLFVGTTWFLYQKSQEDPVIYETDAPYVTDIINKTVAIGSITPRREVSIKSQVSGVVDELYVEPGQSVESGDVIARMRWRPDMQHGNQAQGQVGSARIDRRNADRERRRQQRWFREQLSAEAQYNRVRLTRELQVEAVKAAH